MDSNNFLVQPLFVVERQANYKAGEKLRKAFTSVTEKDEKIQKMLTEQGGYCGNVNSYISVNLKTRKISFDRMVSFLDEGFEKYEKKHCSLYEAISPSLALYRTICLFDNPHIDCEGNAGYKVPWTMLLLHNKTNIIVAQREWKGAFGIGLPQFKASDMPQSLKRDVKLLLETILSDKSPHPYDGLVAGSVA